MEAVKPHYMSTEATVITPGGETEFFKISTGILQVDTIAPFIFIIVLDYVLPLIILILIIIIIIIIIFISFR